MPEYIPAGQRSKFILCVCGDAARDAVIFTLYLIPNVFIIYNGSIIGFESRTREASTEISANSGPQLEKKFHTTESGLIVPYIVSLALPTTKPQQTTQLAEATHIASPAEITREVEDESATQITVGLISGWCGPTNPNNKVTQETIEGFNRLGVGVVAVGEPFGNRKIGPFEDATKINEEDAEAIDEVLTMMGANRLAGASRGGMLASMLAAANPKRYRRLDMLAPAVTKKGASAIRYGFRFAVQATSDFRDASLRSGVKHALDESGEIFAEFWNNRRSAIDRWRGIPGSDTVRNISKAVASGVLVYIFVPGDDRIFLKGEVERMIQEGAGQGSLQIISIDGGHYPRLPGKDLAEMFVKGIKGPMKQPDQ